MSFAIGARELPFAQQFRFAVLESLKDPSDFTTAFSVMMIGGVVSDFLGH